MLWEWDAVGPDGAQIGDESMHLISRLHRDCASMYWGCAVAPDTYTRSANAQRESMVAPVSGRLCAGHTCSH